MPLLTLPQATSAQSTFPTAWRGSALFAVEFSPTTSPTADPVWVDITSRVMSVSIRRGRQRDLDRFEAGTAELMLDNSDRLFDPSYDAGVYYGNLLPMRKFRIRSQYGNAEYKRFVGFADSFEQIYDEGNRAAFCRVRLTDAFKLLNLTKPTSPWVMQVQSKSQYWSAWYRLSEAESAVGLKDSSGYGRDGSYVSTPTMAQTGLVANDSNTCVQFAAGAYAYSDNVPSPANYLHAEGWFSSSSATAQTILAYGNPTTGNVLVQIEVTAGGQLRFVYGFERYSIVSRYTTTAGTYLDGAAHHVSIWCQFGNQGTILTIGYSVDGDANPPVAYDTAGIGTYPSFAGRLSIGSSFGASQNLTGKVDEVLVAVDADPYQVSPGYLAPSQYAAGSNPYAGDATGTRVGRVLNAISWPTSDRDIDTGNSTLQSALYTGSALDHLQDVTLTEQGQFFVARDGKIRFRARRSTIGAASSFTFKDANDGSMLYQQVALALDDTLIRNSVTAQRAGGGEVTVDDSTSIGKYLPRTYSQTGLLYQNDAQTRDFAAWIINRYKDPQVRATQVQLRPERNPTVMYPEAFGLEIGDLVTLVRTPQGVGTAITRSLIVAGISEQITPADYSMTVDLYEADTSSYWILDDATYSVLDSTTRLAF